MNTAELLKQKQEYRPKNTTKAYKRRQQEYRVTFTAMRALLLQQRCPEISDCIYRTTSCSLAVALQTSSVYMETCKGVHDVACMQSWAFQKYGSQKVTSKAVFAYLSEFLKLVSQHTKVNPSMLPSCMSVLQIHYWFVASMTNTSAEYQMLCAAESWL